LKEVPDVFEYAVRADLSRMKKNSTGAMETMVNEMARDGWRLVSTEALVNNAASYIYFFFERERPS
jgi:uncharacterized protein DUF4177